MNVRYSTRAKADLEAIFAYTVEHWGWQQADRYVDQISAVLSDVAAERTLVREIVERPGLYQVRAGSHYIIFTQYDENIEVRRILHVSMDTWRHI